MGTNSCSIWASVPPTGFAADNSKLEKVFISHLHINHAGDIAALWVGGSACCLEPRNGLKTAFLKLMSCMVFTSFDGILLTLIHRKN
jgi:hypothetical protein